MSEAPTLLPRVDSSFILDALEARHVKPGGYGRPSKGVFFREMRVGTGYGPSAEGRIDAWAMDTWPSSGFLRTAYEVKVSRGDFKHEMKHPAKRRRALLFSNLFYFATPVGLIRHDELPPEAGLIEVDEAGMCKVKVAAIHRDTMFPTWHFVAALARRLSAESTE